MLLSIFVVPENITSYLKLIYFGTERVICNFLFFNKKKNNVCKNKKTRGAYWKKDEKFPNHRNWSGYGYGRSYPNPSEAKATNPLLPLRPPPSSPWRSRCAAPPLPRRRQPRAPSRPPPPRRRRGSRGGRPPAAGATTTATAVASARTTTTSPSSSARRTSKMAVSSLSPLFTSQTGSSIHNKILLGFATWLGLLGISIFMQTTIKISEQPVRISSYELAWRWPILFFLCFLLLIYSVSWHLSVMKPQFAFNQQQSQIFTDELCCTVWTYINDILPC